VCRAIGEAAFFLGYAGRRGDRGGEAGELEVDWRCGDFSPKFRRRTCSLARGRSRLGFRRKTRKEREVGDGDVL
jgi:hypothetical protein